MSIVWCYRLAGLFAHSRFRRYGCFAQQGGQSQQSQKQKGGGRRRKGKGKKGGGDEGGAATRSAVPAGAARITSY